MDDDKKRLRLAEKLGNQALIDAIKAEIAAKNPPKVSPEEKVKQWNASREADGVIALIWNGKDFRNIICQVCGEMFAANNPQIHLCSDKCRKSWLNARGIEWDSTRTIEDRWGTVSLYPYPLVIEPPTLRRLAEFFAQAFPGLKIPESEGGQDQAMSA